MFHRLSSGWFIVFSNQTRFVRLSSQLPRFGPIYYVTDAMSAAGAPPGRYALGALQLEVGSDQIVRQPGQPYLSGSALRPVDGVLRAARMLGCSWRAVWARFSETPAAFLGLTPGLAVSRPANFCVLGTEGHIQEECVTGLDFANDLINPPELRILERLVPRRTSRKDSNGHQPTSPPVLALADGRRKVNVCRARSET